MVLVLCLVPAEGGPVVRGVCVLLPWDKVVWFRTTRAMGAAATTSVLTMTLRTISWLLASANSRVDFSTIFVAF